MSPEDFAHKWSAVTANERAVAQSHFNDLCALLDVPNPMEEDPSGTNYAFERHVRKAAGGKGFADVWKRGAFAWEYKGKGKNLDAAYLQLLLYRDDLENPPLLVVSDIDRIVVHTNFTGTTKEVYEYSFSDLLDAGKRAELRRVWTHPESFNPQRRRERITEEATEAIGGIALKLRERGHDAQEVAHYMMQLVFALFAEDTGLLPKNLVTRILERNDRPDRVARYLSELFQVMATGGEFMLEDVEWFNGGLFNGAVTLPLETEELALLHEAARKDWARVEPAIFGTLFERSLDPAKRSQLGAHYTSREDILRIVEPVVMQPLREEWQGIRETAEAALADPASFQGKKGAKRRVDLIERPVTEFIARLHDLRILDPACGSGNFLYVALQSLKDLEHEVVTFAEQVGAPGFRLLGPKQFHGIEINPFARELASMVIWIGYLQWNTANGKSSQDSPILKALDNIQLHDALLNDDGSECEWPAADAVVGNPPFLGGKRLRSELGDDYVDQLFETYDGRVERQADLVVYWFEKARSMIEAGTLKRAGLLSTNSIRGGANRRVLDRIKETGDIFMAWPDEPWVLDGAAVRVSMVGFDDGSQAQRFLNGHAASSITSSLTGGLDMAKAVRLKENADKSFMGVKKVGAFDIPGDLARSWLSIPNPTGVSNRDVIRPTANGIDLLRKNRDVWVIDFNQMSESTASRYVVPFEHVKVNVRPVRQKNKRESYRNLWWLHAEPRSNMRRALAGQVRYLATPAVAKHRVFVWLPSQVLADGALLVFAFDDDYSFGVLHSRIHEVWSLAQGTSLGVGNDPRYTPSTTFETFPFPEPTPEQHQAISQAAKYLDEIRRHLLVVDAKLTTTNLYNELDDQRQLRDTASRAFPLLLAHESLDQTVAAAYGWDWPLSDDEILAALLQLNLDRVALDSGSI